MSTKVKQSSGENGGKMPGKTGKRRQRVPFSVTKQQRRGLAAAEAAGIPPIRICKGGGRRPRGVERKL